MSRGKITKVSYIIMTYNLLFANYNFMKDNTKFMLATIKKANDLSNDMFIFNICYLNMIYRLKLDGINIMLCDKSFSAYNKLITAPITETLYNRLIKRNLTNIKTTEQIYGQEIYYLIHSLFYYIYKLEKYNDMDKFNQGNVKYWENYLNLPRDSYDFHTYQSLKYISELKQKIIEISNITNIVDKWKNLIQLYSQNYSSIMCDIEKYKSISQYKNKNNNQIN